MDIALYIMRFLYRIKYQVLIGSILIATIVAYFTQFMPKKYVVSTSIYTGIVSDRGIDDDSNQRIDTKNIFENIINLTKSRGTLEKVSTRLLATNLMKGSKDVDNLYITSKNYKSLLENVPNQVLSLIDSSSVEKTINNLNQYKKAVPNNYLYGLFNWDTPFYSFNALNAIKVKRIGNSDIIQISYESTDPGITTNTVNFVKEELISTYNELRYKSTNDVIGYYERQLKLMKSKLTAMEDRLTLFNLKNKVINYPEQTKALAFALFDVEKDINIIKKDYQSSTSLLSSLDKQMETRSKLFLANTEFLKALDDISSINGKITEMEIFTDTKKKGEDKTISTFKKKLKTTENKIGRISNDINQFKYSKEGVAIQDMVDKWLEALVLKVKSKASLKVMEKSKAEMLQQQEFYSPVGTEINRREREIRVTENSYLAILRGLNLARLKQKNIQVTSANLNTISPPTFPLTSSGSKRMLLVIAAFIGTAIFITGIYLIIELLDHTLRDQYRAERLSGLPILGIFTGFKQMKFRGYIKACNRYSAAYTANRLSVFLKPKETMYVNLISIDKKEGKSFIAEHLQDYWVKKGLKVQIVNYQTDYTQDASYLLAEDFDFYEAYPVDIVLVEHPPMELCNIPNSLLQKATVNLLIANAKRAWRNSDTEYVKRLKANCEPALYLYLNNVTREVAEDFMGNLPPTTTSGSMSSKIRNMGLTASESSAVR